MGIYQEVIYAKYGKHPKEALFYTHALPLPGFLLLAPDIWSHFNLALASPPFTLLGLEVPSMLIYLALNVATQYICISGVFVLTTECQSLTVTLVITIRKFLSLLFSIWYFSNPFTVGHWLALQWCLVVPSYSLTCQPRSGRDFLHQSNWKRRK